jgi:hypothetical protein
VEITAGCSIRDDVVHNKKDRLGLSSSSEMLQNYTQGRIRPVMSDETQEENFGIFNRLRSEEVMCCAEEYTK